MKTCEEWAKRWRMRESKRDNTLHWDWTSDFEDGCLGKVRSFAKKIRGESKKKKKGSSGIHFTLWRAFVAFV